MKHCDCLMLRVFPIFTATLLCLTSLSGRAQAALDPPTLTCTDAGPTYLTFRVTAGASGAPAGFVIEWMTLDDYNTHGGWPPGQDPSLGSCWFSGTPTLNTTSNPDGFSLPSNGTVDAWP